MTENIIIANAKEFERKKKIFREEGSGKIHVVSDFDRTLTKAFVNGKKVRAIITQLYEGNSLTKDYREKAQALHDKYYPIEVDNSISLEEKKVAMEKWWREHKKLLIDSGLNLKDIKDIVDNGYLEFREGVLEFFDLIKAKEIPLIVFSSSGLGDAISLYFKKINRLHDNVHIISNSMEYDEEGNAVGVKEPVIHVFNKGEIALKGFAVRDELKDRKNVLLIGDSLGDLQMSEGFDYDNIIRIGFFNYADEEKLDDYKEKFDVVILNDGDMSFVNDLLGEMLG